MPNHIPISIPIIVAGTGGANPDSINLNNEQNPYINFLSNKNDLCLINKHIYHECYGYADIKIDIDDIVVRYHHVSRKNL